MGHPAVKFWHWGILLVLVGLSPLFTSGESEQTIEPIRFPAWDLVTALAWSPDGELIAVASGTSVYVFPAGMDTPVFTLPIGVFTHSLSFNPDSQWLAAGSRDGRIRLWELNDRSGKSQKSNPDQIFMAHRKGVNSVQFNPQGDLLASGGSDAVARLWDWQNGRLVNDVIGGTFAIPAVVFITDEVIAIANGDIIRLRDPGTGRFSGTFKTSKPVYSLAASPDGRLLSSSDIENGLQIWEVAKAYQTGDKKYPEPVFMDAHSGSLGTFRSLVWDTQFSPDGQMVASAGGDGNIFLWDLASGEKVQSFYGHQAAVTCLAFSPDGRWLASGGLDAVVRFWLLDDQ